MNRAKQARKKLLPKPDSLTDTLIRSLVHNRVTAARALELFYWSKEPGLLEVIRGIAAMTEETRGVLEAFVGLTSEPKSAVASLDASGMLRLSSADVARSAALARCVAEDETPRVLN